MLSGFDEPHFHGAAEPLAGRHWTRRYFGPLYAEIYSKHLLPAKRTRDEAAFVASLLAGVRGPVLDIAAGFGRHSRILARYLRMIALDANGGYLRAAMAPPTRGTRTPAGAVQGDMRLLPVAPASCGAAILLFNSFGYFGTAKATGPAGPRSDMMYRLPKVFYDRQLVPGNFGQFEEAQAESAESAPDIDGNLEVLREITRILAPGGRALVEIPNPVAVVGAVTDQPRLHYSLGAYAVEEEFRFYPATRTLANKTRFRGPESAETADYAIRLYDRAEATALFREAGLRVKAVHGGYDGSKFHRTGSGMMLFEAEKPQARKRKGPA